MHILEELIKHVEVTATKSYWTKEVVLQIHQFPCLFSSNLNHNYIKPTFIAVSLALFEMQTSCFNFFHYQYVFILCILPRKRKGREKDQSVFYKMIVNGKGSNWHSKISHQINTAHMGPPKPKGLYLLKFMNEKKGWGKEQMGTCFSNPPSAP